MKDVLGKKFEITFLDHSSDTSTTIGRCPEPTQCVLTLTGWVLSEDKDYYLVETVRCNCPGNSETWSILKTAIIDIVEVREWKNTKNI